VQGLASRLLRSSGPAARLSRLLCDERVQERWLRPRDVQVVSTAPSDTAALSGVAGSAARLLLHCAAGEIDLALACPGDAVFASLLPEQLDPALRLAAAQVFFSSLLQDLRELGLPDLQCTALQPSSPATDAAIWADAVLLRAGGVAWVVAPVALPQAVIDKLMAAARNQLVQPTAPTPSLELGALRAPGIATLWQRNLRLSLLRTLAVGDVLVLPQSDTHGQPACGSATVAWGARNARRIVMNCRREHNHLLTEGEITMVDETDAPDEATQSPIEQELGDLDVPLRFELDTVPVPLSDLQSIRPGYVIEFAVPVKNAALRLVAFGQTIGHAELVAVGDHLGARITRMVTRDESEHLH
jgi:type III secretion protein Q